VKVNIGAGGPLGIYFAILINQNGRANDVTIVERDGPNDTFAGASCPHAGT
jgi:2-polyprenyl-6-methoxyphenol hydroxylase-like FAD-dependent oxidoreductase